MLYFFFLFGSSIFPVESNNRIYKFVCYKSIFICVFAIVTVNVVIMIFNIAVLKKKKRNLYVYFFFFFFISFHLFLAILLCVCVCQSQNFSIFFTCIKKRHANKWL